MKIIQKNTMRNGKRKYTMANADSSEMMILPTAIDSAITRLLNIMRLTGAALAPATPSTNTVR